MTSHVAAHARRLWLAGADTDSIARALGTHRAAIAQHLLPMEDTELLAGLRVHLAALVESRAKKGPASRTPFGRQS